jgi:hypothetical protein
MLQQDLYHQQRHSTDGKIKNEFFVNFNYLFLEQMMATLDTMRDANDTLSKSLFNKISFLMKRILSILDTQGKFQQNTLISESEFLKVDTSSSTSTVDEPIASLHRKIIEIHHSISFFVLFYSEQQMRTPSPGYARPTNLTPTYLDDQITENSSSNRYIHYDNRPIKPLDQNMLQTKLNQYPVDQ